MPCPSTANSSVALSLFAWANASCPSVEDLVVCWVQQQPSAGSVGKPRRARPETRIDEHLVQLGRQLGQKTQPARPTQSVALGTDHQGAAPYPRTAHFATIPLCKRLPQQNNRRRSIPGGRHNCQVNRPGRPA